MLCSLILLGWRAVEKNTPTRLELSVESVEVAKKFPAYVGGGANIDPPDTVGGGDGIPMISIGGGSSFLAGEVGAKREGGVRLRTRWRARGQGHRTLSPSQRNFNG
jgi:hypothetical protein